MQKRVALLDNVYGCFDKLHRAFAQDVTDLLAEVERLTELESGERKAWANAGAERDRAVQDAADAQAALSGSRADAEAARGDAAYWRRQADRLRLAWESARRGRRQERAKLAAIRTSCPPIGGAVYDIVRAAHAGRLDERQAGRALE